MNKNETQEKKILAIFRAAKEPLSPSQVWLRYNQPDTPLTSIRRGITDLTVYGGRLVKTRIKTIGPFGKPECNWVSI